MTEPASRCASRSSCSMHSEFGGGAGRHDPKGSDDAGGDFSSLPSEASLRAVEPGSTQSPSVVVGEVGAGGGASKGMTGEATGAGGEGMLGKREKREGEGDADGAGWEERKQRIRKSFSVGVARTLSVPQSLNLEQAHMDSPRGMERKQSEANQFITSAADDLKELDGGWAERKRRLSDSLKVDLEKVHENAPANLERKQSEANLHISSAAEDLKELEAEEASGGKSRARALSISVDKAHSNAPPVSQLVTRRCTRASSSLTRSRLAMLR
eukprot:1735335-Rhodomonas_salina.1